MVASEPGQGAVSALELPVAETDDEAGDAAAGASTAAAYPDSAATLADGQDLVVAVIDGDEAAALMPWATVKLASWQNLRKAQSGSMPR